MYGVCGKIIQKMKYKDLNKLTKDDYKLMEAQIIKKYKSIRIYLECCWRKEKEKDKLFEDTEEGKRYLSDEVKC